MTAFAAKAEFAGESPSETFTFDVDTIDFAVATERRRVSGTLLPFTAVGINARGRWKFLPDSIYWNRSAISRVKLNREHDRGILLGSAVDIKATDLGIAAEFKVSPVPDGDRALVEASDGALDGLSAEVTIEEFYEDPGDPGLYLVSKARLTGAALTAWPAFDDSRLTKVAASSSPERDSEMTASAPEQTAPAAQAAEAATEAQASVVDTTAFTSAVEAFTAAVEKMGEAPQEREIVAAGRAVVREPMVYSLNGQGFSFVKDAWEARNGYDSKADDARARLRKYEDQTREVAFANSGNRTDQAEIIPPGYRPDLYVGQVPQGRPLFNAMSTGTLSNATPFKVPVWVGSSGLSGTNTELTGPSTGTITNHTYRTVTPTAQSGEFVISRELIDAANPAIDQIAMAAMREEYARDTEGLIGAALAAATDDGTSGSQSTEGCWVYDAVGDGADLAASIRTVEGAFPFHRFAAPNRVLLSSTGYSTLVAAVDTVGRPLFPYTGGQNVMGTVGEGAQALAVDGLAGVPAWGLTAGTDDVVLFNSMDAWAWESPLLTFRFEEKQGPEAIVLNLWGYFAFQILRYTGIHAISYSTS